MSVVKRKGAVNFRPAWNYNDGDEDAFSPVSLLQMLESVRNAVEQVKDEIAAIRRCGQVQEAFSNLRMIRANTSRIPARRKAAKRG